MESETNVLEIKGTGTQDDPFVVSSWSQFLEKCNITIYTYVKFSDDVENKVIDFQQIYPDGMRQLEIKGVLDFNGWELRNLTVNMSYNPSYMFKFYNSDVIVKNAIFTNILLRSATNSTIYLFGGYRALVYNCSFNGVFEDLCGLGASNTRFYYCSFNISLYGNRAASSEDFYCCNIHVDGYSLYGGSNNTNLLGTTSDDIKTYATTYYPFGSVSVKATDCYIEGKLSFAKDQITDNIITVGFCESKHCIIAFETNDANILTGSSSYTYTYNIFNKDLLPKGVYNLPDGSSYQNGTFVNLKNSAIFLKGLTTEEMKDIKILRNSGLPVWSD